MKVITHQLLRIDPNGYPYEFRIDICPKCEAKFKLPEHVQYNGVYHGLHKGECEHPKHNT